MTLGHMTPSFATQYVAHRSVINAILPGEGRWANTLGIELARFNNLFFGEFRVRVVRPAQLAFLCHFVCHIVCASAQKMMSRIAARGIVAFMASNQAIGNWAMRQFVSDTMRQEGLTATANMDSSIAHAICAALPFPAIIGAKYLHARPESIGDWAETGIVPMNVTKWFALHMAAPVFVSCRNASLFAATAVAITVGNVVRGIMGLHKNLLILVPSPRTLARRWDNFIGCYSSIIPQEGAL